MGNRNIKKETKKPKKSDKASSISSAVSSQPMVVQPTLIKKEKKLK